MCYSEVKKYLDEFWMSAAQLVNTERNSPKKWQVSIRHESQGRDEASKQWNCCDLHACPNLNRSPLLQREPRWAQRKQVLIREEDRKTQREEEEERVGVGGHFTSHQFPLWSFQLWLFIATAVCGVARLLQRQWRRYCFAYCVCFLRTVLSMQARRVYIWHVLCPRFFFFCLFPLSLHLLNFRLAAE